MSFFLQKGISLVKNQNERDFRKGRLEGKFEGKNQRINFGKNLWEFFLNFGASDSEEFLLIYLLNDMSHDVVSQISKLIFFYQKFYFFYGKKLLAVKFYS